MESIDIDGVDAKSKIRYLKCHRQFVYATDLSVGRLFVVDVNKRSTKRLECFVDGANVLKQATGVEVDPAGNVLVASAYHDAIQVLNAENGQRLKTLITLPWRSKPMGIHLVHRFLHVICAGSGSGNGNEEVKQTSVKVFAICDI